MSFFTRLQNALRPRGLDEELAEEIRDHIEHSAADLQAQGIGPAEARRLAARNFGNAAALRERSRDIRLWAAAESTLRDVRYAWRGLLRNPVFAATAVVSLALAIGANTAIYSIVDAVLLRTLPVLQPESLFTLSQSETPDTFSYPAYEQLRDAADGAAGIALFDTPNRVEAQAAGAGSPYEEVVQQFVSPNAFDVLGVGPALGRLFSPAEDRYPAPRMAVVLSYSYWQRRFGGDPAIAGKTLLVSGRPFSILGVARAGFSGASPGKFIDVWLPITVTDPGIFPNAEFRPFHLLGRLAPGVSRVQLAARLQPAFHRHQGQRVHEDLPLAMQRQLRAATLRVEPGARGVSDFRQTFARPLWILLAVSAGILFIACANVASLLMARSTARSGEIALRISLGAGRARLVRQLLTESLLVSTLAGVCAWIVANAAAPLLVSMVSKQSDPVQLDLALDSRVLVFCAAVCALSALLFGLLPAWQTSAARPMTALRHTAGMRLGHVFVGLQIAFAFCLATTGAGFLFTLRNLNAVHTGFDPRGVTVLTVTTNAPRERQTAIQQQMQQRVAGLPQVQGAATGWMAVFSGARRADRVVLPGEPPSERAETFYRVSPGYFATLRTPLLAGRDFSFRDTETEPVPTIVNRAFADRYFQTDSVLGRQFRRDDGTLHQIVGLAADSSFDDLRTGPEPIVYFPMKPPRAFTLYVRSSLDAASVARMVERETESLGSGTRVRNVTTVEALVGNTILREKVLAALGGAFALLGLVLAAIGLFGLLNYTVARRTREIGIRVALGARRLPLVLLVLRDFAGMVAGGLAAGLAVSLLVTRFTRALLFGVQPAGPQVIGTAIAAFLLVAIVAATLPARRAASTDPLLALRSE